MSTSPPAHKRGPARYGGTASHVYLANSPQVAQVGFTNNGTAVPMTTEHHESLNRLTAIESRAGVSPASPLVSRHAYDYSAANQRTRAALADGSSWVFEYEKLGQVISGKRYWADWTPVAGQQFEYAFDDIGNRTGTKAGGDAGGADLRSAPYSANKLNQYTSPSVPGAVGISARN